MGPGAFGSKVGDFQVILEGEGSGHDFAVDRADRLFRKAALVLCGKRFEEGIFTFRGVNLKTFFLLNLADFVYCVRSLGEKIEQLAVDGVDCFANVVEGHGEILVKRLISERVILPRLRML